MLFSECDCHEIGAASQDCETHYGCLCHPKYGGPKCDECADGLFNFPACKGINSDMNIKFSSLKIHKK